MPDDTQRLSYAEQLARNGWQETAEQRRLRYTRPSAVTSADFDQNYEPINDSYPGSAASSYTVRRDGETLRDIAQALWGDASLWFLIADANGMLSDTSLLAGQVIVVPNKVTNIHNNSQTWRPYNAGEAIGSTDPNWSLQNFQGWSNLASQIYWSRQTAMENLVSSSFTAAYTESRASSYTSFGLGWALTSAAAMRMTDDQKAGEAAAQGLARNAAAGIAPSYTTGGGHADGYAEYRRTQDAANEGPAGHGLAGTAFGATLGAQIAYGLDGGDLFGNAIGESIAAESQPKRDWLAGGKLRLGESGASSGIRFGDSDGDGGSYLTTPASLAFGDGRVLTSDGRVRTSSVAVRDVSEDIGAAADGRIALGHKGSFAFDNAATSMVWSGTPGEEIKALASYENGGVRYSHYLNGVLEEDGLNSGVFREGPMSTRQGLLPGAFQAMNDRASYIVNNGGSTDELEMLISYQQRVNDAVSAGDKGTIQALLESNAANVSAGLSGFLETEQAQRMGYYVDPSRGFTTTPNGSALVSFGAISILGASSLALGGVALTGARAFLADVSAYGLRGAYMVNATSVNALGLLGAEMTLGYGAVAPSATLSNVPAMVTTTRTRVLENVAQSQVARLSSNFNGFIQAEGQLQASLRIWPPNSGGYAPIYGTTLGVGTQVDRYGYPGGKFLSPLGASFESRALPPSYQGTQPHFQYEVLQPIENVTQAKALPWFGQRGMGTQFQLPEKVQWYLDNGYLKVIPR